MHCAKRRSGLTLASILLVCCTVVLGDGPAPLRTVDGAVLHSSANPELTFTPAPGFTYVGTFAITLKGVARAERHHWAVAEGGKVEKLLIVQFEGYLDGKGGQYRFAVPESDAAGSNYKFSPRPVELDGVEFVHNTWAFDQAEDALTNPGMEAEATLALLEDNGLDMEHEVIMSRFVQAFGEDSRHELIVFYLEPLSAGNNTLREFPDGQPLTEAYEALSDAVTARSLESFRVDFVSE